MDILNDLLRGKGDNSAMLGALIPLLLGNKKGNMDLSSLLSLVGGKNSDSQGTAKGQDFPPLFAENASADSSIGSVLPLLQNVMGRGAPARSAPVGSSEDSVGSYPYELQYNRPEKQKDIK